MDDRLPERVESPRLLLRLWTVTDAPALGAAVRASLDHLLPWMPWAPSTAAMSDPELRDLVRGWEQTWREGGGVVLGVFRDDVVVGGTGLHRRLGPGGLEIGYWIDVDHVRRGYATELSAALTDAAFGVAGIERVEIHHDAANVVSGKVPARLGFVAVGSVLRPPEAPGESGRMCAWRMTRAEWSTQHAPPGPV